MAEAAPALSIVIPAWNEAKTLPATLEALRSAVARLDLVPDAVGRWRFGLTDLEAGEAVFAGRLKAGGDVLASAASAQGSRLAQKARRAGSRAAEDDSAAPPS